MEFQIVDKQLAVHDEEAATRRGACDCKHFGKRLD
jgi:hypothetical protein